MLKLNLGIGIGEPIEGYVNLDLMPLPQPNQWVKQGDFRNPSTAGIADGSVDTIRAAHVLRHVHNSLIGPVLTNWAKVMAQGGEIYIESLDAEMAGNIMAYQQMPLEAMNQMIYGEDAKKPFCGLYSLTQIEPYLNIIGFEVIEKGYMDSLNFYVRARKL